MGHNIAHNQYHIPILRGIFTRSLGRLFPDIVDEVASTFEEIVSATPGGSLAYVGRSGTVKTDDHREWVRLSTWNVALRVTSRTTNRVFVGMPLCTPFTDIPCCLWPLTKDY